ncbi:MAG: threonine synthase, partial [Lawsonibacter sp.]
SSNLERLLLSLTQDVDEVKDYMRQLNESGRYELRDRVREKLQKLFWGYCCDDQETQKVIGEIYKAHDYLVDPHTAVAFSALAQYRRETGDETPCVVVSTASPFKFCDSVLGALGQDTPAPGLDGLDQLSQMTGLPAPAPLAGLRDKQVRFTAAVEKDCLADAVLSMLG